MEHASIPPPTGQGGELQTTKFVFFNPNTHCTGRPRHCCRHSRRLRRTPSVREYSDGSHTQIERLSKTYLEEEKQSLQSAQQKKLHRCSGAAWRTAVSLVCTVLTVVLLITGPTQRDAASTGTGKVSGVTVHFLPSCKQWPTSQTRDEHIHKFT